MKVFKHLKIRSTNVNQLRTILLDIKNSADKKGWSLMVENGRNYAHAVDLTEDDVLCVLSPGIKFGNKAVNGYVWLIAVDCLLYVSNITPALSGQLNYDEYNSIINKFYDELVAPAIEAFDLSVDFSASEKGIEELAGAEVAKKLIKFSNLANKSTGNINSNDRERWLDFIVTSFKSDSPLDTQELQRWLVEEGGWYNDDITTALVLDYEYGIELLRYYDGVQ